MPMPDMPTRAARRTRAGRSQPAARRTRCAGRSAPPARWRRCSRAISPALDAEPRRWTHHRGRALLPGRAAAPGWPLHRELETACRAARRVIRLAPVWPHHRLGSHDCRCLRADACCEFRGGPLRLLPFVLSGGAATAARVATRSNLADGARHGAPTPRWRCNRHSRCASSSAFYLTLHDLCALTARHTSTRGLRRCGR